jgi:hypothetical protein
MREKRRRDWGGEGDLSKGALTINSTLAVR